MGEVPMLLLMIATAGVTYGWQPDKNSDHETAVEYIVQVSPHELDQIKRSGEITSVIDPRVRGHVSKVIVRVGTERLPRTLPSALASDRVTSLKPAPQSGGRPSFDLPQSLQDSANNLAADVRGTVDQTGQNIGNAAQRGLQNGLNSLRGGAQELADQVRIPPPATRQPTSPFGNSGLSNGAPALPATTGIQVPTLGTPSTRSSSATNPFSTANNRERGGFATTRTNGPSTNATGRDNNWNPFSGANSNFGNPLGSASASTNQPNTNQPNTNQRRPTTGNRTGATGLSASDTFGRSGLSTDRSRANDRSRQGLGGRPVAPALGSLNPAQPNRALVGTQNPNTGQNSSRQNITNVGPRNPNLTFDEVNAGGWDYNTFGQLVDRDGKLILRAAPPSQLLTTNNPSANPSAQRTNTSTSNRQFPASNQAVIGQGLAGQGTSRGPFNQGQINQVTTNQGQGVQRGTNAGFTNQRFGQSGALNPYPTNPNSQTYPQSNANGVNPALASNRTGAFSTTYGNQGNPNLGNLSPNDPRNFQGTGFNSNPAFNPNRPFIANNPLAPNTATNGGYAYPNPAYVAQQRPVGVQPGIQTFRQPTGTGQSANVPSASDNSSTRRVKSDNQESETRKSSELPKKKGSGGPLLFNAIFTVSIVGNFYLFIWLKNLRLQFRDLVAAKRMASSNSAAA